MIDWLISFNDVIDFLFVLNADSGRNAHALISHTPIAPLTSAPPENYHRNLRTSAPAPNPKQ